MQRIHIKKQRLYVIQYEPGLRGIMRIQFSDYKSFLKQILDDIKHHKKDQPLEVIVREDPTSNARWDELGIKLFSYAQRNVMPQGRVRYVRYGAIPISSRRDTA